MKWLDYQKEKATEVEQSLESVLLETLGRKGRLAEACRYAVLGGGKRLRPLLCLAACEDVGGDASDAIRAATAIELVHAYSLVHDDLPAMDDDAMRRGKPTVHVKFDQPTAILVGDALLTAAFEIVPPPFAKELAQSAGGKRLILGQMLDLNLNGEPADLDEIHRHKTGALFEFSCLVGAVQGGAAPEVAGNFKAFGTRVGVAFQYRDDILDNEQVELARTRLQKWSTSALALLEVGGSTTPRLRAFCEWLVGS